MKDRMTHFIKFSAAIAAIAMASAAVAQTVRDDSVPETALNIPGNVQLYGEKPSNVYRPSATVNGEIITATDIEQRMALVRLANRNMEISAEEEQRLRQQIFQNLIDEKLQIQEAIANKIEIDEALIDQQYARLAAQFRQSPDQFAKFLTDRGSSSAAIKQQIRGEFAWDRLLSRNVRSQTNVSTDEVEAIVERMKEAKGTEEYQLAEIYLSATAETAPAVVENARRISEALQRGGSFAAYARQFSEASTAVVGGDLGWVRGAQLPQSMATVASQMQPGQLVGPIEVPGGFSILLMIDRRQVLTADPRDATLSLKQVSLAFDAGITEARAAELAGRFAEQTRSIAGCGMAESVAAGLGATVVARDQIPMRSLPQQLQSTLISLQIGQTTQPFGSPKEGVSVLVLCGRDMPNTEVTPNLAEIEERILEDKINKRAQRYLRDLRRDAVIEYS
jgi:peptidyl-prolyl cis-trans isomerase SurA